MSPFVNIHSAAIVRGKVAIGIAALVGLDTGMSVFVLLQVNLMHIRFSTQVTSKSLFRRRSRGDVTATFGLIIFLPLHRSCLRNATFAIMRLKLFENIAGKFPLANRTREHLIAMMHEEVAVQSVDVFASEVRTAQGATERAVIMLKLPMTSDGVCRRAIGTAFVRADEDGATLFTLLLLNGLQTFQIMLLEEQRLLKRKRLLAKRTRNRLLGVMIQIMLLKIRQVVARRPRAANRAVKRA